MDNFFSWPLQLIQSPTTQQGCRNHAQNLKHALLRWIDSEAGIESLASGGAQKTVDWPRIIPFVLLHLACLGSCGSDGARWRYGHLFFSTSCACLPSLVFTTAIFPTKPSRSKEAGNLSLPCWAMHRPSGGRCGGRVIIVITIDSWIRKRMPTPPRSTGSGGAIWVGSPPAPILRRHTDMSKSGLVFPNWCGSTVSTRWFPFS